MRIHMVLLAWADKFCDFESGEFERLKLDVKSWYDGIQIDQAAEDTEGQKPFLIKAKRFFENPLVRLFCAGFYLWGFRQITLWKNPKLFELKEDKDERED